jgi:hypothetical protein
MTISEFKKIARLLKAVYAELERQALSEGIDITSPQFEELINRVRESSLAKRGFTIEEYRNAKAEYTESRKPVEKTDIDAVLEKVTQIKGEKGDTGEQGEKGDKGDKGDPGKDGKNGKDGRDGKDGKDGTHGRDGEHGKDGADGFVDEETIGYLEEKIDTVAKSIPVVPDLTDFYKEMDVIQEVIKGMPDFRKLGMGLQDQIDKKITGINVNRIIYSVTEPTNQPVGTIWISPV